MSTAPARETPPDNGDGEVNLTDALVMLQSVVGGANKYSLNTVLDVLQYIAAK